MLGEGKMASGSHVALASAGGTLPGGLLALVILGHGVSSPTSPTHPPFIRDDRSCGHHPVAVLTGWDEALLWHRSPT